MDDVSPELLRDFAAWADRKSREIDLMMLDEVLGLRSAYDELPPTYWPLDSVEHLLLERLPGKGPVETYDPEVLTETLDAYFKFLRSTGRMAHRSADPKELTKEVRRHARRMQELAEDRTTWSPNKVLADFGRGIGIDLDHADDFDDLQRRLGQIQEAWNALPVGERQRLMPHPDDPPGEDPDDLTGLDRALWDYGVADPIHALIMTFAERLPEGELPASERVAPIFRESGFLRTLLELVDWVADGRAVTATGVLRPALAKDAYRDLGLGEWTREQLRREYPDESLPGVAAVGRDAWIEQLAERPWSRAADCPALHRLWVTATAVELITVSSTKAVATTELPHDTDRWAALGTCAALALLDHVLELPYRGAVLVFALLTSYVDQRRQVTWDEMVAFHRRWFRSPKELQEREDHSWYDSIDLVSVREPVGFLADTGVYEESDEGITLTEAGDVVVSEWLHLEIGSPE